MWFPFKSENWSIKVIFKCLNFVFRGKAFKIVSLGSVSYGLALAVRNGYGVLLKMKNWANSIKTLPKVANSGIICGKKIFFALVDIKGSQHSPVYPAGTKTSLSWRNSFLSPNRWLWVLVLTKISWEQLFLCRQCLKKDSWGEIGQKYQFYVSYGQNFHILSWKDCVITWTKGQTNINFW